MSERVGDRLLIGILVLIACFAVFVTVSGQSSPTPKHGHCNPFDPDCDADATFTPTPTPTPTPVEVWPTRWTYTGNTEGECATFKREQSKTSNLGNTKKRLVADAYGDETWPAKWTDTGEKRGSGADREKKQSKTSSCSRTRTQWVDDPEDTPTPVPDTPTPVEIWPTKWTDTGNTRGRCATLEEEQSKTSNLGNTKIRWVSDRYGDETWPRTWTDTGERRGSGADREKKQSKTSSCSRTRTRWVDDPEDTPTPIPTPVSATGSLRVASSSIYVAASTTVYAEWDPPELTVNLDIATSSQAILWRSERCSGGVQGSIGPELPSTGSLTVWGCRPGSGTVELRNFSDDTVLASVTITVKNPPPTSTPPAVLDLTATASTTSVRLSWDEVDGASKYRVEHRLSASTGNWTPVDTTASAHTVTSLTPGTSYAFKVRAFGDGAKYKAEWGRRGLHYREHDEYDYRGAGQTAPARRLRHVRSD